MCSLATIKPSRVAIYDAEVIYGYQLKVAVAQTASSIKLMTESCRRCAPSLIHARADLKLSAVAGLTAITRIQTRERCSSLARRASSADSIQHMELAGLVNSHEGLLRNQCRQQIPVGAFSSRCQSLMSPGVYHFQAVCARVSDEVVKVGKFLLPGVGSGMLINTC